MLPGKTEAVSTKILYRGQLGSARVYHTDREVLRAVFTNDLGQTKRPTYANRRLGPLAKSFTLLAFGEFLLFAYSFLVECAEAQLLTGA